MKATTAKTTVALMGAVALAGSAAMGVAPALAADAGAPASSTELQSTEARGASAETVVAEGVFAYDQAITSSNATLKNVFMKAASAMCASIPEYGMECAKQIIFVKGPMSFSATVDDMASENGTTSYQMTCSCASNVAGGGAIANAEASGVSLASVASLAGAL